MRIANKNDIDKISMIRVQQQKDDWKEEYDDKYDLVKTTKLYLKKHLNNDFFAFIEEIDGNIVSICCLQIIECLPQCNDNGKQGYICNVYTDKNYRNKGIQTKLLKEVINYSIEHNLCELNLSTDSDIAISIYKKCGFKFDNWAMKTELKGSDLNE